MTLPGSGRILERLEWPQVVERLRDHARTPRGRARCQWPAESPGGLLPDASGSLDRLVETSEAKRLLEGPGAAPLGGLPDLDPTLRRLGKGGLAGAPELLDVASALATAHATRRFLSRFANDGDRLSALARSITELHDLEGEITSTFDSEGQVRDSASTILAQARAECRALSAELQRRVAACLQDPSISPHLSDRFVTVRNDRFVIPVRSDARGHVRGIVHDASHSGTTVFVEPEAVVEPSNRLKRAELEVQRETLRVLRELSARAAEARDSIESNLEILAQIDLAFARAALSIEMRAVEPEVGHDGVFRLPQLRHPLLDPDRAVANDVVLGEGVRVLVLSGPNAGGKTVLMKAIALAALFVRAGLHVTCAPGARVDLVDELLGDIGDEQDLRESLSTFSAHVANLARIVGAAGPRSLVALDEIGQGTDPSEGASLAQALLERLADSGARVVATTHFNLLKEMAGVDPRFENASFEFDPETLAPTYRLRPGVAGVSSALAVAARMGLEASVLERANALLDREDRRLDRLLTELAASRISLETEQREARRLRAESEAARSEYREKLEDLQARRDALYRDMRRDLDRAFKDAHAQVAAVIRDLQRGGGAREAAHARERLVALADATRKPEAQGALPPAPEEASDPIDWRSVRPGDPVRLRTGGEGTLVALPDRRGRALVQMGAARLHLPADALATASARPRPATARTPGANALVPSPAAPAAPLHAIGPRIDLRGLRVDEALSRVESCLDRAAASGETALVLVHGLGSGALRDAVRRHLSGSPYVAGFAAAEATDGGDGVTLVRLSP
ncbi:Endonuclease MutS2 [Myxococcaceae bacterium]|jgi:DNA mismatch repair protein MutS2|nr:Endonuclease MutS2 [Myxococcaceae bacterium]